MHLNAPHMQPYEQVLLRVVDAVSLNIPLSDVVLMGSYLVVLLCSYPGCYDIEVHIFIGLSVITACP